MDNSSHHHIVDEPTYRQIYGRYRDAIVQGRLRPGDRVPSVRALAAELNLARGTVEAAYSLLIGEGYLQTRGPAGTIVSPDLRSVRVPAATAARLTCDPDTPDGRGTPLPLQMGLPALDAFPRKLWARLAGRSLRHGGTEALAYPDPQGHPGLRQALSSYLGIARGIACHPDQVFICAGYRACLELVTRTLLRPGDRGWFEEPGYFIARHYLMDAGFDLMPVPVDDDGMDISAGILQAPDARFAVVTPSHQSPMGVSLSLSRRQALLAWADASEAWIVEDDYDSEFRYVGRPLPALKSLDANGRVLYTGTFSKVLVPGLRLAYLVVPPDQIASFSRMAHNLQHHCPYWLQATAADFMSAGHFGRHIRKMRNLYAQRRHLLVEALREVFNDRLQLPLSAGGMHILAKLDGHSDDVAIANYALHHGLAIQPLSRWHLGQSVQQGLMMNFTNVRDSSEARALASRLRAAFGALGL
ncbi:MocR-like pyridoxine biosynthesis transcription factor PdxR [Pseudomonas sp. Marseille-QA0892]